MDLAYEGAIERAEALRRVSAEQLATVLAPRLHESVTAAAEVLARGIPACPGVAAGAVVADSDAAEAAEGDAVLARPTTSPEDVPGMIAARAVVTERGGSTSHAAVVTRALGRPSVVGVGDGETAGLGRARGDRRRHRRASSTPACWPPSEVRPEDVPGLEAAIDWARELSPVAVVDEAAGVRRPRRRRDQPRPRRARWTPTRWPRACAAPTPRRDRCSAPRPAPAPFCRAACPPSSGCPASTRAALLLRLAQEATSSDNEEERAR